MMVMMMMMMMMMDDDQEERGEEEARVEIQRCLPVSIDEACGEPTWLKATCSASCNASPYYRKIKDIKQYTVDEGKKVNDSLKAYQIRYDQQLRDLDTEMENKFNTENEY